MLLGNTARNPLLASLLLANVLGCTGTAQQATPDAAQTIVVDVVPGAVEVAPGAAVGFAATVTGTANTSVLWGVQELLGGTIDASGLYTAPASAGTFHVTATSNADPSKQAGAVVTVTAPPPITLTVAPTSGAVDACQTFQFTATVTGTADTAVTWTVQEGAAGGSISTGGLYTAPAGPGTYHVVAARTADPSKTVVVTVAVSEKVLAVAIAPQQITVAPGGTAQFTATITNTCGTFTASSTVTSNGTVLPN